MPLRKPLSPSDWRPALDTLTRSVVPVTRSRTKMSERPFVSPATRLSESEANATKRPSALIAGSTLSWLPCRSALLTLTSSVNPGACAAAVPCRPA